MCFVFVYKYGIDGGNKIKMKHNFNNTFCDNRFCGKSCVYWKDFNLYQHSHDK